VVWCIIFFQKSNEGHFNVVINHFLGVSYAHHRKGEATSGVSFRYLLNDSKNEFKGDAMMFATHHNLMNNIGISPSFIISNNFKTIYPSLSISFSLF
jgi:hypothetical protein